MTTGQRNLDSRPRSRPRRLLAPKGQARDEIVARLWRQDKTLEEIGRELGATKQSVMRWVQALRSCGVDLPERGPAWVSPKRAAHFARNHVRNQEIRALLALPDPLRPTYQQIADQLSLTRDAVSSLMRRDRRMGRTHPLTRRWTAHDERVLRRELPKGFAYLARRLKRTERSVKARATILGLL